MGWQTLIAALLVLACSGYAAWTLMPTALRARLRPGRPVSSGCGGCDNCGPAAPKAGAQPIRIVRRPPSA
jgi:hypothetical protein